MNELLEDSINVFIQKCPQVSDFPKVCRVCLSQSALHPIFKLKKDISEKIRQCSRIFIKRGDGLPDKICEGCVSLLKTALHFRALSESSDSRLREAIALKQDKKVKKKRGKHFSKDEIDTPLIEVKSEITTDEECEEDNVEVEESGTEATLPSKETVRTSRVHECEYSSRAVEKSPSGKEGSHYECVVCTQMCPDSAGLTSHMADQHGKHAEYSCHGCDLTFKSKGLRLLHERRHCPKMPPGTNYQCRKCPAVLVTRTQLNQHARRHEGGAGATLELGELHACPVCHKTFSTKTHFKKHLKVHEATTPLSCEICGKLARTKGGMHNHMKTHSERLLACSLCPYRTNLVQSLVLHTRHHTGEKPFACEWCAHRSISMSNLQKHRLIHTGERKYECSECHKTYNAKQTLMLHMNSHLGLRPYCCHKCGKEYTRPSHLRTHIQRQHPEESSSQRKVKPFNNEKGVPPDLPKQ